MLYIVFLLFLTYAIGVVICLFLNFLQIAGADGLRNVSGKREIPMGSSTSYERK